MSQIKLKDLKKWFAEMPSEFDEVEVNWVDFAGGDLPNLRAFKDGAIISNSGGEPYQDKRDRDW